MNNPGWSTGLEQRGKNLQQGPGRFGAKNFRRALLLAEDVGTRLRWARFGPNSTREVRYMLEGKCAVVTGASARHGIGFAIADALASKGCHLMLAGSRPAKAADVVTGELSAAHSVNALYHRTDLTRPSEITALIKRAMDEHGGVDILVNNAGINHPHPIDELTQAEWDEIISVNLSAAYHTVRHTLPAMKQRNWGRIINVASVLGLVGSANVAAYVASKHGLVGLTKTVALETAHTGITCNAICPGYSQTDLLMRVVGELAEIEGCTREEAEQKMLEGDQPSRTMVPPADIGALAVFLCSEAAQEIRGAAFSIDGGWSAR